MKRLIAVLIISTLFLTACSTKTKDISPLEAWASQEQIYPTWSTPVEYIVEADNPYGPRGSRMSYTKEEAQLTFNQTRYLVENHEFTDDYPLYNLWKYNLATDALLFNEPLIAYKIASEFEAMEKDAVVYKMIRKGEVKAYKIDEDGLRMLSKIMKFRAMTMAGFEEEAKAYYESNNLANAEGGQISLVWSLNAIGMDEAANNFLDKSVILANLSDRPHGIASNVLGAVGYYYANGNYDKVIQVGSILLDEGIDSTSEEIFRGRDRSSGYYNNHWTSSYKLVEKYVELAKRELAGEVVDFSLLRDGEFTADNTGYILTPVTVVTTVKDGKIMSINADQFTLPKDDRSGTATVTIPENILKAGSIKVDAVATATITSESVRLGVIETLLESMGEK